MERDIVDQLNSLDFCGRHLRDEAAAEILRLRAELAAARNAYVVQITASKIIARNAALEDAANEAASWQGLKGRAISDKIRAMKGLRND